LLFGVRSTLKEYAQLSTAAASFCHERQHTLKAVVAAVMVLFTLTEVTK
jgi:hypothetical protein